MKNKRLNILILTMALFLITGLLSGCGAGTKEKATKGMALTSQKELDKLFDKPETFKDKEVTLGAYIFDKANKGAADVGFSICNDIIKEKDYAVVTYKGKDFKLDLGDYALIKGKVVDTTETENMEGETVTVPKIEASKIVETSAVEAMAPATKVIDVNKKVKKDDVEVEVLQVAFSDRETRVYTKITNNSDTPMSAFEDVTITQKEKRSKPLEDKVLDGFQYAPVGNLLPNTYSEGAFALPKISQEDFSFAITMVPDDYDSELDPFIFDIKPKECSESKSGEKKSDLFEKSVKLDKLFENPKSFDGKEITLGGYIEENKEIGPEEAELQLAVESWQTYNNLVVSYKGSSLSELGYDDIVLVKGKVKGTKSIKNELGVSIDVPKIEATEVIPSTFMEAISPTTKTVDANVVAEQYGISVKVDKVEFSEYETRVFVTVTNNSSDIFDILSGSRLVQSKKVYEDIFYSLNEELPDLSDEEIGPGASVSGVLLFEPLKEKDMKIYIEGYSENYDLDLDLFELDIKIK